MKEIDVETILQRAQERFPGAKPRGISGNGPQFVARDFKLFIREAGMTHVRTSSYYPQSNGKIVRLHSGIGWITPADKLAGREEGIWAERDRHLEAAREARRQRVFCV